MNKPSDELDWLAARYVLGELDAAETASFEARLADDEVAAAAVVKTMGIVEAVAAAKPVLSSQGVPAQAARSSAGWGWLTSAVAAGLAIAILPFVAVPRPVGFSEPADIVRRWQRMPLEHVVGAGLQATIESPSADRLPPWLLAAVAIAAEGGDTP